MAFTKVTSRSYGSRVMNSFVGVLIGVLLFLAAFPVIWLNEGNSVRTAKGLKEGAANVVGIELSQASTEYEGKLVHGAGKISVPDNLTDDMFGINVNAVHLQRKVEMYQWKENTRSETVERVGGSEETITTYTYEPVWSSTLIQSGSFEEPDARTRHANPTHMPYENQSWTAQDVMAGEYKLSSRLVSQIPTDQLLNYTNSDSVNIPDSIFSQATVSANQIYIGTIETPGIGDIRITHSMAFPGQVSVLGQLNNGQIGPYKTQQNTTIEILKIGSQSADEMIASAQADNVIFTWLIRLVGFLMFFIGLILIFKPLSIMGSVLPFFGRLLSWGFGLVAGIIAFILTLVVIAVAWIFYRPVLGVILLAVAAVLLYILLMKKKQLAQAEAF